jgi:vacuolar-type H+-ATPase subunit I/STV1
MSGEVGKETNGWNEWSMHVLKELERLNNNYEKMHSEIQKTNQEITRVSGMKHAINDLKAWKESLDEVINKEDLRAMKAAFNESINQSDEIEELKDKLEISQKDLEELKRFKSNWKTVITIVAFVITTAAALIGYFFQGS